MKYWLSKPVPLLAILVITNALTAQVKIHLKGRVTIKQNYYFKILPSEVVTSGIPVCCETMYQGNHTAITNEHGEFELDIKSDIGLKVRVSANTNCGSESLPVREDIMSAFSEFRAINPPFVELGVEWRSPTNLPLVRANEIVQAVRTRNLIRNLERSRSIVDSLYGSSSILAKRFPMSSQLIHDSLRTMVDVAYQELADSLFGSGDAIEAARLYTQLIALQPFSPMIVRNEQRLSASNQLIGDRQEIDSLLRVADVMTDKRKAIGILQGRLKTMTTSDPLRQGVERRVQKLEHDIESEKAAVEAQYGEEAEAREYQKNRSLDEAALKRYAVDLSVSQIDLFANPFAFKGKCIALACVVNKFETPTSAIMEGGKSFYADFKVTPPKKLQGLFMIARVRGVRKLVNAFGTSFQAPHVEVLYLLHEPPDQFGQE